MRLPFIEAGEIVTTHGVRGEVKVLTWLDSPEMLCDFDRCRIDGKEWRLESVRVQKTCNLVKIEGIDSMEAAQALRGKVLELFREDMDESVIFGAELIGMEVVSGGETIGKITEVLDYPGNSVYVVRGSHEYMIPAVKEFVLSTDLDSNVMEVKLLEGMRSDENGHHDLVPGDPGGRAVREHPGPCPGAGLHRHPYPPDPGLHCQ